MGGGGLVGSDVVMGVEGCLRRRALGRLLHRGGATAVGVHMGRVGRGGQQARAGTAIGDGRRWTLDGR